MLSILEKQRSYHEERERLMDQMVKEMLHKKTTHRETINSEHRIKFIHGFYVECSNYLKQLYEDKDGLREKEVAALSGPNALNEFYKKIDILKEHHRPFPNDMDIPMTVEMNELVKLRAEQVDMEIFAEEEGYGEYLDLHECYNIYISLKGFEKIDYLTYLSTFDNLFDIPKDCKDLEYLKYLDVLLNYMYGYVMRVRPLLDLNVEVKNVHRQFLASWDAGNFPGWPKETGSALTHLDPSVFEVGQSKESEHKREIASLEAQIYRFSKLLSEQRNATKAMYTTKKLWTDGERDYSDSDEKEASASESEDEDSDMPHNPENLPLGWDGKVP